MHLRAKDGLGRPDEWHPIGKASKEFDVFLTGDRNLTFQQKTSSFAIAVVVLHAESIQLRHTLPLMRRFSLRSQSLSLVQSPKFLRESSDGRTSPKFVCNAQSRSVHPPRAAFL